jgi:hypothetical protein
MVSIMPQPWFTSGEGALDLFEQKTGWASKPAWIQRLEEKSFSPARN